MGTLRETQQRGHRRRRFTMRYDISLRRASCRLVLRLELLVPILLITFSGTGERPTVPSVAHSPPLSSRPSVRGNQALDLHCSYRFDPLFLGCSSASCHASACAKELFFPLNDVRNFVCGPPCARIVSLSECGTSVTSWILPAYYPLATWLCFGVDQLFSRNEDAMSHMET